MSADHELDPIDGAVRYLTESGVLGFAQLDAALRTEWQLGPLTSWIPAGQPVCEATTPFFALEADLLALQDEEGASLTIPRVGLSTGSGDPHKMSVEVFWQPQPQTYLVVVSRLGAQSGAEYELVKQMRARRLAEDNYRQAKARLEEQQHLIDLVIDHAPAAIAMFDRGNRYIFATKRWSEIFGLRFEPVQGRRYDDLAPYAAGIAAAAFQAGADGLPGISGPEIISGPDGTANWVRFDHQPWRRADGSIGGVIAFADVLTGLYTIQRALREQNAQLERTNRALDEFASIIAHDLSAPIRAMRYAAEDAKAAGSSGNDQAVGDALDRILSQAGRMETMLRGLLEYSRLEIVTACEVPVDLRALVADIARAIPGAAAFHLTVDETCGPVKALLAPLDLILRNLIDNAVKHHDRDNGSIAVSAACTHENWAITVADDGPGIDPRLHDDMFKPFWKSPEPQTTPGSGIGLALIKRTVESFGGSITVTSDPAIRRGTAFTFTIPKAETAALPPGS